MSKIKKFISGNKKHPNVVTGNFSLHYEDVVKNNRYLIITILGIGILGTAMIVPIAAYRSVAEIKPEVPSITNTDSQGTLPSYAPTSMTLSAGAVKPVIGKKFEVNVTINSPLNFSNATAYVEFDAAVLNFSGASITGSTAAESAKMVSSGKGYVRISQAAFMDATPGARTFATITFTPVKSGTTTMITINKSESAINSTQPQLNIDTSITI